LFSGERARELEPTGEGLRLAVKYQLVILGKKEPITFVILNLDYELVYTDRTQTAASLT
jgi:hypothetical protein